MATKLEIVNIALARINLARVNSLDASSKEAKVAALMWDTLRDATLRAHPWGFAERRRRKLDLFAKQPPGGRLAYQYPGDALAIRKVLPSPRDGQDEPTAVFEVGDVDGKTAIFTQVENALADYTARIDNCSLYDDLFVSALAYRLAGEFATAIKSDYEAASGMLKLAEMEISRAGLADARETVFDDSERVSDFEKARWS